MFEYLLEPFLVQFYLLESICGGFLQPEERRAMFLELARVFCIPQGEMLEEYYRESESEDFRAIDDMIGYERLCRTIEFAGNIGQDVALNPRDRLILAQKRKAMAAKAELFGKGRNITRETAVADLTTKAMGGNIDAMNCLAYMEYHGIFLCQDPENAISRARLCARWNDLFGNLFCIAYDRGNRQSYYDTLYTVLRSGNQQQAFTHICAFTGHNGACQKRSEARIMEKAFGMEVVKRNIFDRNFAKVAFSQILSAEDKEKILLNRQAEAIDALAEIPFDVNTHQSMTFRQDCAQRLPLRREDEIRKILQNFAVAMNCPGDVYNPLMIVAGDEFLLQMYSRMLRCGLGDTPVVEIDAGTLTPMDFSGSKDNVFLRGLCETRCANTVFLVKDCQELTAALADELVKVLDYSYRRKYKLFQPAVSLDLSGIRFILLSGGKTAPVMKLAQCCDTVFSQRIRGEEKAAVIDAIFRDRARAYGREKLTMEEPCQGYLATFTSGQVRQIVDGAIRGAVFTQVDTIGLEDLQMVCKDLNITPGRREFGYTGGDHYA